MVSRGQPSAATVLASQLPQGCPTGSGLDRSAPVPGCGTRRRPLSRASAIASGTAIRASRYAMGAAACAVRSLHTDLCHGVQGRSFAYRRRAYGRTMDTNASPQIKPQRHEPAEANASRPRQRTSAGDTDRTSTRREPGRMKVDGWVSAMLDDFGLDPHAFRAYLTIARRAGADGTCYESVANMATRCRMSERRLHIALRELERRGLVERIVRAGRTSVYRRLTPTGTPAPRAGVPPHQEQRGAAPRADKGLPMKVNPWKKGGTGNGRTMQGARAAAANRHDRASLSQQLDIDREPPPARPPAADDIGMDPRLVGSEALMDRLSGKGSGIRDAQSARVFFTRLLGAANAKHPQVEPRRLDWYRQYGEEYITSVWHEAKNAPDPHNPRKAPLYYLIDALDGRFYPRAHAERAQARAAAREPDPTLEPGTLVMLPNGETHVLDNVANGWAYLEGVGGSVRISDLRLVHREARP